jgi:hypothetical protein
MGVIPVLTENQVDRLLALVDSGKPRNWLWLVEWLRGEHPQINGETSTPSRVIAFFEEETRWQGYRLNSVPSRKTLPQAS